MLRSSLLLLLACAAMQEVVPWHSTTSVVAQEPPQLQYLTGHAAPVYAVGVAPDGKTIVSASVDGQLKAWDRATGEAVATWSSGDRAPLALAVSPDGLSVAVGGLDRTVRLFDLPRRHPRSEWTGVPGVPAALLLSADGKIVFTADSSGNVRAWDSAMKTVVRDFAGTPGPIGGATLLSSTGQVIAVGGDGILRGWKVADAAATGAVAITPALGVAAAPDEKRIAVAAHDGLVRLVRWPPVAPTSFGKHNDAATAVTVSPDGKWIVSGGRDQQVLVFQAADGKQVRALAGQVGPVTAVGVSGDSTLIAATSATGTVRFWKAGDGADAGAVVGSPGVISGLAFHPKLPLAATTHEDGTLRLWSPPVAPVKLAGHTAAVQRALATSDGKTIVTIGADAALRLFDATSGKAGPVVDKLPAAITAASISPDRKLIVVGDANGTVQIFGIDGKPQGSFGAHSSAVASVSVSPSGKTLLTAGADGVYKRWTLPIATPASVAGLPEGAVAAALSRDASVLIVAGPDGTPVALDAKSGKQLRKLAGKGAAAAFITVAPDQSVAAVGDAAGRVTISNVADGAEVGWFGGHDGPVLASAWHPKESQVATAGADGTVRLWRRPAAAQLLAIPKPLPPLGKDEKRFTPVAASVENPVWATGLVDGSVQIHAAADSKPTTRTPSTGSPTRSVALRRDGVEVAAGDATGAVRLFGTADGQPTAEILAHEGSVQSLNYHPSGQQIISAGADGFVKLLQLPAAPATAVTKHAGGATSLALSVDGSRAFTAGADKGLVAFDLTAGQQLYRVADLPAGPTTIATSVDGQVLALGDPSGVIRLRGATDGAAWYGFGGHTGAVRAAAFRAQGGFWATAGDDGAVRVWEAPAIPRQLVGHTAGLTTVSMSPNGQVVATASADKTVRLWNVADGTASWTFTHPTAASVVAWRADSTMVATGGEAKQVRIWNATDGQQLANLEGHAAAVTALAFTADGNVVSGAADGHLKFWNLTEKKEVADLAVHGQAIVGLAALPGGQRLAALAADGSLAVLQLSDRMKAVSVNVGAPASSLAASADGKWLAVGGRDKSVRLVAQPDGKPGPILAGAAADITGVAISNDSMKVAASTADGAVRVWGIDGTPADMVDISPAKATGVAFTADPKWLVVTGDDQRARIVRLSLQRAIAVGKEPLHALAFTPDGNSLAVAGKNQPITLWNPQTGMQVRSFGAADTVSSLQISNDGQRLISAGGDKHVRVWQLADGAAVAAWPQAAEPRALRLNRDGSRLVISGADGQARLVETATGRVLQRFAAEGGANVATPVPDGRMVVVAAADGQVRKHNVVVTGIVAVHPGGANAALFLPNGQAVASCGADKGARVSDMTGKTTVTFAGCDAVLAALALRQDGAQLAAVGQDQHLYVWPTGNNQLERKIPLGAIGASVAYSPDGTRIAATCGDGNYRVYQAADGRPLESASSRGVATSAVWLPATPAAGNVPGTPDRLLVGGDDGQAALVTPTLLRLFAGHAGAVNGVVFTPDGQTLLSGGVDKSVRLWNVANAQVVRALSGPTDAITGVAISGDGARVAAVGLDKQVRVWNFADGAVVATLPSPTPIRRLVASPDGTRFATTGDEAVVRVFETSTGREVERIATAAPVGAGLALADQGVVAWSTNDKQAKVYRVGAEQVVVADAQKLHAAVFGVDGEQIVTSGEDRVVKLWGADGKLVRQFGGAAAPLRNLAPRGDGQVIVAGGDPAAQQTIVYAWRTATGEALPPLTAPSPIVGLSLGGLNRVAVATADQHVRVYSQDDNRLLQDFTLPAPVSSVAFAADGKQLVASTADQSSYVLKCSVERLIAGAPGAVFTGVVFSPDGESFFTSGTDRLAKQWSLNDGRLVRTFSGSAFPLTAVSVSRDGRTASAAGADNIMRLWSVPASMPAAQPDAKPEAKPAVPAAPAPTQPAAPPQDVALRATITLPSVVRGLALNSDGTRLATGGDENVVHWWDTTNGKQLERLTGHTGAVLGVTLLADGSLLSASADTTVRRATPSVEAVVVAHETATTDVEFSPDGKTLFTCGADKLVRQWSTDGLGKLREFAGAAGPLKSLAVSADGGRVAAVGDDAHVRLWKVEDGRPLAPRQLPAAMHSLLLTKDGGRAIVGGADSIVRNISITPDGEALKLDVATELRGHTAPVTRLVLGADDRTVYSSGVDQTVREWVAANSSARREWRLHEGPVYGLAFSADSLRLVSGGGDGRAIVVHTRDEAVAPITVGEHQGAINSVAFHAGGKQFATTGDDGAVRLWDDAGKLVKKLSVGLTGRQQALSYSPDGNHLVVGGSSKLLFAVNRDSAQIVRTLEGHNDSLYRVAHNATGTRWATIDYSGHLFIWDAAAGGLLFHQQLPVATAHSLVWNPDGTEIVVATSDPRVLRVIVPPPAR